MDPLPRQQDRQQPDEPDDDDEIGLLETLKGIIPLYCLLYVGKRFMKFIFEALIWLVGFGLVVFELENCIYGGANLTTGLVSASAHFLSQYLVELVGNIDDDELDIPADDRFWRNGVFFILDHLVMDPCINMLWNGVRGFPNQAIKYTG